MIRQAFRKLTAFLGLAGPFNIPTESPRRVRPDTSIPKPKTRRRTPHGNMRIFRSYR